ncbi:hypothetical protein M0R45_006040 [Rubus argutus]|uniref:Uncharacterized protein n=1 Tax=Rubus argutus TaxID=59490 RepID=A0AAW1YPD5_RUBAR
MNEFNNFICDANLCDPSLQNANFTWSNNRESVIWCRLDMFFFFYWVKWGPSPFRLENMWLEHPSFKDNFKRWWGVENFYGWAGFTFMRKLRSLKEKVKVWSKEMFGDIEKEKRQTGELIMQLDAEDICVGLCDVKRRQREVAREKLEVIIFQEESRWRQRAKLDWAKEGDNNTSFFHIIINGRRKRNFIE